MTLFYLYRIFKKLKKADPKYFKDRHIYNPVLLKKKNSFEIHEKVKGLFCCVKQLLQKIYNGDLEPIIPYLKINEE